MLVRTYDLERCVETPITLGQNDPCMPTLALFLQYSKQRDFVAATMAGVFPAFVCAAAGPWLLDFPNRHGTRPAAALDPATGPSAVWRTCSAERPAPSRCLVVVVFRQSYRMARLIDAAQA